MFTELVILEEIGEGRFLGAATPDKGARTFGGQFLAQALRAAQHTVSDDRDVQRGQASECNT
ncbi:MAG: hypothetical protein GKR94_11635 [Gammaproteobacteria bacterium]|nr:hypothetical protein [Gammaproteobacteria bacterium]